MSDLQPASTLNRRRARPAVVAGAIVLAMSLSACGGNDEEPTPATTTTAPAPPAAAAPPEARLDVTLTPGRVGTPDRPQRVRIAVDLRMQAAADADPADVLPVRGVDLTIPAGVLFRSEELAACAPKTLEAGGPTGCPEGSRIGLGTIDARAGTVEVVGQATAVYGGDDRVLLWVEISNPVSVGAAIEGRLTEQAGGGYRLALQVPAELQDVAGLPVALDRLRVSLGRGDELTTTACPDGGLPFTARLDLGDASAEATASAACR